MIATCRNVKKKSQELILVTFSIVMFSVIMTGLVFANEKNNQFVPGEVMIKFKLESEPNRLLTQAIQSKPPNIRILAPVTLILSDKISIPLQLKQILSGGWVLGVVDADKLIKRSVVQLGKKDRIAKIQLRAGESKTVVPPLSKEIDVTFQPGSPEDKILEAKQAGHSDDSFAELIHELANCLDIPLQGKVDQRGHLILQLDLREITIITAKRLRGLSELIDSVQLNYISTIM